MPRSNKNPRLKALILTITGLAVIFNISLITYVLNHWDDHNWKFSAILLGVLVYGMLALAVVAEDAYRRM